MKVERIADLLKAVSDAADGYEWKGKGDLTTMGGIASSFLTGDELTCLQAGYVAGMCDAEGLMRDAMDGTWPEDTPEELARSGMETMGCVLAKVRVTNVERVG